MMYRVRQGDCFHSVAAAFGFSDWQEVYDHASNKDVHPDPDVLEPGTDIEIPEHPWFDAATSQSHRFTMKRGTVHFRLILEDEEGNAWSGKSYELEIGATILTGTTAGDGLIEHDLDARANRAELRVQIFDGQPPMVMTVRLGTLDPKELDTGVQARLNALDYECGSVDGDLNLRTRLALERFQLRHDLEVTGEPDDATRAKLEELTRV
jgi:hypothetical protein